MQPGNPPLHLQYTGFALYLMHFYRITKPEVEAVVAAVAPTFQTVNGDPVYVGRPPSSPPAGLSKRIRVTVKFGTTLVILVTPDP